MIRNVLRYFDILFTDAVQVVVRSCSPVDLTNRCPFLSDITQGDQTVSSVTCYRTCQHDLCNIYDVPYVVSRAHSSRAPSGTRPSWDITCGTLLVYVLGHSFLALLSSTAVPCTV